MISVLMKPGRTALKRTFTSPYSLAALRIISSMPALPTQYAPNHGWGRCPAMEDMPTNDPPPAATMWVAEYLMLSMVPSTLRWSTRVNSAVSCKWYGPMPPPPPALAMKPLSPPKASTWPATRAATSSSTVTSVTWARTFPGAPDDVMRSTTAVSLLSVRPQMVTSMPSAARRVAQAAPMPVQPPVTIALRPDSDAVMWCSPSERTWWPNPRWWVHSTVPASRRTPAPVMVVGGSGRGPGGSAA